MRTQTGGAVLRFSCCFVLDESDHDNRLRSWICYADPLVSCSSFTYGEADRTVTQPRWKKVSANLGCVKVHGSAWQAVAPGVSEQLGSTATVPTNASRTQLMRCCLQLLAV